jgi:tellurite resistance protein TerC
LRQGYGTAGKKQAILPHARRLVTSLQALQIDPAMNAAVNLTYKVARRIVIGVAGGTILLLGIIMLVTPGPALVVIPVGLAILGLEFAWARHWLNKVRRGISDQLTNHRARNAKRTEERYRSG